MVSIITVTHNRASMIGETIRSVLAQTYSGFEYIIADDGSEDNTEEVVNNFSDSRIRYFRLPHTGRISMLRNFGIEKSKGELIAFIDSDDLWKKEKLALQAEALNNNSSVGFVFTDVTRISNNSVKKIISYSQKHKHSAPANFFLPLIGNKLAFYPSSLLFRKSCIHTCGMLNEKMIEGEQDFITRLAYYFSGILIPKLLVTIKIHHQNHSAGYAIGSHLECIETLNLFFKKKVIGNFLYRKVSGFHHRAIAKISLDSGNKLEAKYHFRKSISLNPADIKSLLGLITTGD